MQSSSFRPMSFLRVAGASCFLLGVFFCGSVSAQSPSKFQFDDWESLEKQCIDAVDDEEKTKAIVEQLEAKYPSEDRPEAVKMLLGILTGNSMGVGNGWFKPAGAKYGWDWLANKQGIEPTGKIVASEFVGQATDFKRLDRNGDGDLQKQDFDWSDSSPYIKEISTANWIFRQIDQSANSRISKQELSDFFDRLRGDDEELSIDKFRRSFAFGKSRAFLPGDAPSQESLLRGFFRQEIGSHQPGPGVGETAPDFELMTSDGRTKIRLSDYVGNKPVALIFGNFTCGPFRRLYPDFDEIAQRYQDKVNFIGVYVREAHPEDGWIMESNNQLGVRLKQPKTMEERKAAAKTCSTKLNYSIPLLVDTMDDHVGSLYSGMPARAYIIGTDGKVIYQSGRGPFGFLPLEMEQTLILSLMQ